MQRADIINFKHVLENLEADEKTFIDMYCAEFGSRIRNTEAYSKFCAKFNIPRDPIVVVYETIDRRFKMLCPHPFCNSKCIIDEGLNSIKLELGLVREHFDSYHIPIDEE